MAPPLPGPPHCFMKLAVVTSLGRTAESGTWYRAIQLSHLSTPLKTGHTRFIPSRFNAGAGAAPPFRVLYLAENSMVALFEVSALLGSPAGYPGVVPVPSLAWVTMNVKVNLRRVADLTDPAETDKICTTAQELTGDWRAYQQRGTLGTVTAPTGIAPTQHLGAALAAMPDLEGFRTLSARLPYYKVLVVLPDNLDSSSSVEWQHPTTGQWSPITD
jgi:hypothetical protein